MDRSRLLTAAALLLGLATFAPAAKVKVWHQSRPSHYDKAQLNRPSSATRARCACRGSSSPWPASRRRTSGTSSRTGTATSIVATGDEGKIYKVDADGKASVVYTSDDSQVLCLAACAGRLHLRRHRAQRAASSASTTRAQAKVIHDGLGSYVWSLAVDAKGETSTPAPGRRAASTRLTPDGKASVFYTTKQEHILCLAVGPDGQALRRHRQERPGLSHRRARARRFVLYQAPQAEVRTLQVTADGVYAGTSAPTGKRRGGGSGSAVVGRRRRPPARS